MKNISKISKKVQEWATLMNYDISKIRKNMNANPKTFGIEKLTNSEAQKEGLDLNYPYKLFNPYGYSVH